jgi:hypothetical protein
MEIGATEAQMQRKIWLLGHSYPKNWVHMLTEPLDPRHPTRHSIWTPVLDRLQEQVYGHGNRRRLDAGKCYICNAASKQGEGEAPDWEWTGPSITARMAKFGNYMDVFQPPIVITFGAEAFRFAATAINRPNAPTTVLSADELGGRFRAAVAEFNANEVNVFPLLHAFVARNGWVTAGMSYSTLEDGNYFEYVGCALGRLLLSYGKEWPIWVE